MGMKQFIDGNTRQMKIEIIKNSDEVLQEGDVVKWIDGILITFKRQNNNNNISYYYNGQLFYGGLKAGRSCSVMNDVKIYRWKYKTNEDNQD